MAVMPGTMRATGFNLLSPTRLIASPVAFLRLITPWFLWVYSELDDQDPRSIAPFYLDYFPHSVQHLAGSDISWGLQLCLEHHLGFFVLRKRVTSESR